MRPRLNLIDYQNDMDEEIRSTQQARPLKRLLEVWVRSGYSVDDAESSG